MTKLMIAVTSANGREVTGHSGKARRFWIYEVEGASVVDQRLLELTKEQTFHESSRHEPHPLDECDVLITGGLGRGLMNRLASMNIVPVLTDLKDLDEAVEAYVAGRLQPALEPTCSCGGHHPAHH